MRCCASRRTDIISENEASVKTTSQDWRKIIPGLLVSIGSMAIVIFIAKPARLVTAIQGADYRLVLLGGIITVVWLVVRAVVWRTLLQRKATYRQVFDTLCEGYMLNNFLPFRLGEVGRALLLSRKANISFWEVFSSIIIERSVDILFAAGLLFSTLPFVVAGSGNWESAFVMAAIVVAGLGSLYLMARHPQRAQALIERLVSRVAPLHRLAKRALPPFFSGLQVLTSPSRFLVAMGWFLLNYLLSLVQFYILMRAFFPDVHFIWVAFVLAVSSLGIAVPSSPGGVGVFEGAVMGALAVFGLNGEKTLAYAIVLHLWSYLVTGVLGSYALAHEGETLTRLYERLRSVRKPV